MLTSFLAAVTPVGPDAKANSLFELDPFTVTIISAVLIPLIVGFLTRPSTNPKIKAAGLAVLSIVAGTINVAMTDGGGALLSQSLIKSTALTALVAIATHFGLYKPLGVTGAVQNTGVTDSRNDGAVRP